MNRQVLIAHAPGEEDRAELLAGPIRNAGYEVKHRGTLMIGESFSEEASKVMQSGGAIVLCGTVRAIGTGWAHLLVNAARQYNYSHIFAVQMEKDAYLSPLSSDRTIALYWQDPAKAINELMETLAKYYPLNPQAPNLYNHEAENRYRQLALESCDIIDLANLPESDRHLATKHLELRRLYVALRVRVEIGKDAPVGDTDLNEIEKRREASRRLFNSDKNEQQNVTPIRFPVGHRLSEAHRLIILGDPGSGKTTLVRWIATSYLLRLNRNPEWNVVPDVYTLPDKDLLPVIIRCRDLEQTNFQGSLDQILTHTFRRTELSDAEAGALLTVLKDKLTQGEALLLVDGLDEIVDPLLRIRFCQQLEQIHIAYQKAPIIVTSRIVGYRELSYRIGRGFEHVSLVDLSKEDKDDFAQRWCVLTETPERRADASKELIHDIHSTDRIERLTGNPMLLTTLALVKRKIGSLPSRRADLYWSALEVLLNWRREVDESIDHREALPQLEYVAYAMCERGVAQLREDELIELLDEMRKEYPQIHAVGKHSVEEFIKLLERRTAILIESGHVRHLGRPTPLFEFRHLTFQEYLAGMALVAGRFPRRDRSRSLAENIAPLAGQISELKNATGNEDNKKEEPEYTVSDLWREAIRLCVASCNDDDVDAALLAILTPLPGENERITGRSRAVLAVLCLADDPNATENTVTAVLEKFVKHIDKRDGKGVIRTSVDIATKELAGSRWARALHSLLLQRFLEANTSLRYTFGNLCAISRIADVPEGELPVKEWLTRKAVEINSDNDLTAIGAALEVMFNAYQKSAHYHVPSLAPALLDLLTRNGAAAFAAAWTLNWINRDKTFGRAWQPNSIEVQRIIELVKDPSLDETVVRWLIYILTRERVSQSVEVLISRLEDPSESVRVAASQALGWMDDTKILDPLISRFDDKSDVQKEAILSLGQLGDVGAVDTLIQKLEDQHAKIRESAIWALGLIGDDKAVSPFIANLQDPEISVRRAAAWALSTLHEVEALPLLISKLESDLDDEREYAVGALGRFGDDQAIEPLLALVQDRSSKVRYQIAVAIRNFNESQVVPHLIHYLKDEDLDVQEAAAEALGWIGDQQAVEPLITKLQASQEVSKAAIRSLGLLADTRAVDPLIKILNNEKAEVRQLAIMALSQIGGDRVIAPLLAKLEDSNAVVRQTAAGNLGYLGHTETINRYCGTVEDLDIDNRALATEALTGLALNKFESGDIEGSAELFKLIASTAQEGEFHDVFNNDAAFCFILLQRFEEAAEQFDLMEFSKRDKAWPLYQHNRGILYYVMGDVDRAEAHLFESLRWMKATSGFNTRDVGCMLVLRSDKRVFSYDDLPIDAGVLINLHSMGAISEDSLNKELLRRYPTEFEDWLVAIEEHTDSSLFI